MIKIVKWALFVTLITFVLFYLTGVYFVQTDDRTVQPRLANQKITKTIALFGASGTAGDGILKATLASPEIEHIIVVTRRLTPRMEEGVASGKVTVIQHMDYLNYEAIINQLAEIDTVYWAIGISAINTDEKTYGMIHTDFPLAFLNAWLTSNSSTPKTFQFISSSDISEESDTMWVREKIRAENTLFNFAQDRRLKVIAHRPDYIGPTSEQAHLGQNILYWFFSPVGVAIKSEEIGMAMIEISARIDAFENGSKFSNLDILRYSEAYKAFSKN